MKSKRMKQVTGEYEKYLKEHKEECAQSGKKVKEFLLQSTAAYDGLVVHTLQIPKIFTEKEIDYFRWIVKMTYGIIEKVIQEYIHNPSYRAFYPFSKELEELILVPNLYDSVLPIARFDIFFQEDDWSFKFCEINTDGTSAMNEDYVLNQALAYNNIHQEMQKKYEFSSFELYDSWVKKMMELYETYEKKVENPYIVITDFMDHCCKNEFKEFAARFEKAGYQVEICNIRDFTYQDGILYSAKGHKVDLIYRRAVTVDVMAHYQEVQPFIQAVKNQDVCVMGSFCTQIPHHKWMFRMLHHNATKQFLKEEENQFIEEHVPFTNLMDDRFARREELLQEKDRWIMKPLDSYASQGVFAGVDYYDDEWEDLVYENWNKGYIYQEYCAPYRTENICYQDKEPEIRSYTNMTGLYVYQGEMAGVYSRLSTGGIISSQYNERAVATIVVKEEEK